VQFRRKSGNLQGAGAPADSVVGSYGGQGHEDQKRQSRIPGKAPRTILDHDHWMAGGRVLDDFLEMVRFQGEVLLLLAHP
jgi:hypothetical protein